MSCSSDSGISDPTDHIDDLLLETIKSKAPGGHISNFILPASEDFENIPQDPNNPLSREKIALGGFLFHETGLAVDAKDPQFKKTFSCASCHHAAAGFQAGIFQGIGEGGTGFGSRGELRTHITGVADADVQPVRSPSAMNGAFQTNQLWNGQFGGTHLNVGTEAQWAENTPLATNKLGFEGLETQAIAGMTVHRLNISDEILQMSAYKALFDIAFKDVPVTERYTKKTAGLAIAAYERTLIANKSPFQLYLRGQTSALTTQEKNGAILFFGKAGCTVCHKGPALNSMQFNALGMGDLFDCPDPTLKTQRNDPSDLGRGGFTKKAADNYKFKVPQLYNLKDSPFYGHGSTFRSIRDVIEYKNKAVSQNPDVPAESLDPSFKPLGLNQREIDDLEAFLSRGLYDPQLTRYVPMELPSRLCFPNADLQSKKDTNCF